MSGIFKLAMHLNEIGRCPQCGVSKPSLAYAGALGDPVKARQQAPVWVSYRCTTCNELVGVRTVAILESLAQSPAAYMLTNSTYSDAVIPAQVEVDNRLPEKPRRYLSQAINSIHSPDGAVMLAGSAIDAMLKLKGFTSGSVYARIEEAVKKHILTEDMSKWAHAVRLESNKPRHADLDEPHATQASANLVIDFAKALGDFLFVLPALVSKGTAEAQAIIGAEETVEK